MSSYGLNELVGKAAINDSFRAGLLIGRRAECVRQFADKLEPDEQAALLTIQAGTLAEFAAAVERLIEQGRYGTGSRPVEPAVQHSVRWPNQVTSGVFMLHE